MDSSSYHATWFYMSNRLILAFALLIIVIIKERQVSQQSRWLVYGLGLLMASIWVFIIYFPGNMLPQLVIDGVGTTALKNNLQYFALTIQFIVILFILFKHKAKSTFHILILVASIYTICSDLMFTLYITVYGIENFLGHIFQLAGFYFLLRALYYTSVEEPFQKQKEAEGNLKQSEQFLQTVTSHMGEGLMVLDSNGMLKFMNREAERILQWSNEELQGKFIHNYIHYLHKDGSVKTNSKCNILNAMEMNEAIFRTTEDYFTKKDKSVFPVSYVITPYQELGKVTGSIIVFQDISQQKKDKQLIEYMAYYDELTGLPNRRYFKERLRDQLQQHSDEKVAVLLLDIERFTNINESLGYNFGDKLLQALTEKLRTSLPPSMILARLSGDEFTLCIPSVESIKVVTDVCQHIQNILQEPIQVQHLQLKVSVNIGIAMYPDHGETDDELLKNANNAMVQAKENVDRYKVYNSAMAKELLTQLVLENDLHQAVSNGELFLQYQPQINVETGEIFAVEALVRWNHPIRGFISPAQFIPMAEKNGLIIPIGEWVLRTACKQVKQWHHEGFSELGISVNLSTRQFYQDNLINVVEEVLEENELLPSYLELEITESMAMMNIEHSMEILQQLKKLGVRIAIDDFGTGYSSLNYLKHLPFDRLKIDQSFVRELSIDKQGDATIVSMIVSMAHHLKMDVIAEGVENVEQLDFLRQKRCTKVQGYLFSKPLAPEQLTASFYSLKEGVKSLIH
ncbi:EAL domain-containing protein [Anaerobacillus sp. MEB173]|uniref:bifunctional diguanylate cyclase/phosphodiesterase n=1 Tax=Anaerobacillus sp. MEB173 TaxID=3383345 RepID=UPI003F8FC506